MLNEAGKHYGEGIIKNYSIQLMNEVDKKYNTTNLKRMRQFYRMIEKGATLSHYLSWSHYVELIILKDITMINYYIEEIYREHLTIRQLREKIKNCEYERLPEDTKKRIIENNSYQILDFVKDPIIIKSNKTYEKLSEKILHKLILENIPSFLKELGIGFAFIENEYKIKIGNQYNYIDLLLFNYEFNCYVVIELKITELKKEHIGQIQVYMNYIDNNLKKISQDKTIGIIICRRNNQYIIEYCSDKRIISREFQLKN